MTHLASCRDKPIESEEKLDELVDLFAALQACLMHRPCVDLFTGNELEGFPLLSFLYRTQKLLRRHVIRTIKTILSEEMMVSSRLTTLADQFVQHNGLSMLFGFIMSERKQSKNVQKIFVRFSSSD